MPIYIHVKDAKPKIEIYNEYKNNINVDEVFYDNKGNWITKQGIYNEMLNLFYCVNLAFENINKDKIDG